MKFLGLRPSDEPALIDVRSGNTISFREVLQQGHETCAALVQPRELLFLLCRNDLFTTTTYAGALDEGHVVALLDDGCPIEATGDLLALYRPAWCAGRLGTGERLAGLGSRSSLPSRSMVKLCVSPAGPLPKIRNCGPFAALPSIPSLPLIRQGCSPSRSVTATRSPALTAIVTEPPPFTT